MLREALTDTRDAWVNGDQTDRVLLGLMVCSVLMMVGVVIWRLIG